MISLAGKRVQLSLPGIRQRQSPWLQLDWQPGDRIVTHSTVKKIMKETLVSGLHNRTGRIHIVGLFGPDGKICIMEDIGRHNALDKVIGYGLQHNVDFSRTIVTCSGRLSSEMARKCLIANIPIIASRGATTTLAISMGEQSGLRACLKIQPDLTIGIGLHI